MSVFNTALSASPHRRPGAQRDGTKHTPSFAVARGAVARGYHRTGDGDARAVGEGAVSSRQGKANHGAV